MVLNEHIEQGDIEKVSFRTTDFIPGVSKLFSDFFTFLKVRRDRLAEAELLSRQLSSAKGAEKNNLLLKLDKIIGEWD